MHPLLPSTHDLPLFDAAHTRRLEQRAAAMLPAHTLMRRAGLAVARLALAAAPHASRIWVAAGPGNNGGDGFEAAMHLQAWGKQVGVSLVGEAAHLPPDARDAMARAQTAGVRIVQFTDALDHDAIDLAIDALLGIGATRAPEGAMGHAIALLNGLGCPVVAVDVPSGLDVNGGQPFGTDCVVATHTLALLTVKPGLFTGAGRDHSGRVWFDALGAQPNAEDTPVAWLAASQPLSGQRAARRHAQHKGSFGDVAIVGGAPGMNGAALLAARAALAAGAGRVFVEPLCGAMTVDPLRPELMFRAGWSAGSPQVLAQTTVVCGCGGGDTVRGPLPRLISLAGRLVLDADALNALARDASLQALLVQRAGRGLPTVLTPHPLEAARLLGCHTAQVQSDRLKAGQALADRYACTVVLKGSGSVIAQAGQTPRINATGNAALATAGTGDVLAGWLGGLWAQSALDTPFNVAQRAVREHGAAAEPQPLGALCASDLIGALQNALR